MTNIGNGSRFNLSDVWLYGENKYILMKAETEQRLKQRNVTVYIRPVDEYTAANVIYIFFTIPKLETRVSLRL